jgi:hypothetical protein
MHDVSAGWWVLVAHNYFSFARGLVQVPAQATNHKSTDGDKYQLSDETNSQIRRI